MEKESITKEQIEEFFITLLFNVSKPYTSYLNFPDNNSFTYCLKEIKHSLNNCITNNLNNNYSRILIDNFYRYMQKDIIFKEVDSINFKNAISQSQLPFELPGFEKDINKMIIEEGFGNVIYGNLIIHNYPNLQSIIVKKNSLNNLNSLKIFNCEKLKTIEIEDGAFRNVKNVIIESIFVF